MSRTAHKLMASSGGSGGYEIDQSLTQDQTDTPKLRRTPSSEGNRKTFTFSTWCKRSDLGNDISGGGEPFNFLMGAAKTSGWSDDSHYFAFGFFYTDQLVVGGWVNNWRITNRRFRDSSAWYHLVLQFDTTQGTADNRIKIYVNGVQETSFSTSSNPSQNYDVAVNNTVPQSISDVAYDSGTGPYHFDGYMAETYLIDGTIKAASDFGETDSVTGQWIPKEYTGGSYGTNGYYMKFASGAIGTDSSGQGNNYTTTNLANSDVVLDTPTNNFPTVNSTEPYNTTVSALTQGNRKILGATYSSGNYGNHFMTFKIPESGKWYVEMLGGVQAGLGNRSQLLVNEGHVIPTQGTNMASNANSTGLDLSLYHNTLDTYDGGSTVGTQVTSGLTGSYVVLALAIDVDNNKVYGGYDSGSAITWLNSGDPAGNSNGTAHTFTSDSKIGAVTSTSSDNANRSYNVMNFGQSSSFAFSSWTSRGNADGSGNGDFYYSPPSGFKALCSKNLPTPATKNPEEHFNTVLYAGSDNGAVSQSVTGVGFEPTLVWLKRRDVVAYHAIWDQLRGEHKGLSPSTNAAEATDTYGLETFDSDGFTVRESDTAQGKTNTGSMVSWNWKANGTGASDSSKDITATVSANTASGFSIVTYTAPSSDSTQTVPHGLGVTPKAVVYKVRNGTGNWTMIHTAIDGSMDYMKWNDSDTNGNTSYSFTSSTIPCFEASSQSMVAYVFAEVEGFSKISSYTGNGSANGPFINTGFRPAFTLIKNTASNSYWWEMMDNTRSPFNVADETLYINVENTEYSGSSYEKDFISNGFKVRNNASATNGSGVVYFYMSFAESPFKYANAR